MALYAVYVDSGPEGGWDESDNPIGDIIVYYVLTDVDTNEELPPVVIHRQASGSISVFSVAPTDAGFIVALYGVEGVPLVVVKADVFSGYRSQIFALDYDYDGEVPYVSADASGQRILLAGLGGAIFSSLDGGENWRFGEHSGDVAMLSDGTLIADYGGGY